MLVNLSCHDKTSPPPFEPFLEKDKFPGGEHSNTPDVRCQTYNQEKQGASEGKDLACPACPLRKDQHQKNDRHCGGEDTPHPKPHDDALDGTFVLFNSPTPEHFVKIGHVRRARGAGIPRLKNLKATGWDFTAYRPQLVEAQCFYDAPHRGQQALEEPFHALFRFPPGMEEFPLFR